eukprot:CAMPEP_0182909160 /NCGR_PEP_ID=MMETSP0034_2-20130328/35601_1 /TAXON_ID=156128 /ORGANISM="Nephroselmis pyriformis, Strain CCMP717" /LENGTH=193 /DNA_ID=CAMNT_0025045395 /DNA_START=34 /DNA_END=615 /DNA_ORIENTATION=-
MEALPREELERLRFFETAREQAEIDWRNNPADAQALTRWGGALLELAHFRQGPEAITMIDQAVVKFEAALQINPKKHDALWCLGNALTSQGFLYPQASKANEYFQKAAMCFQKAVDEDPTNDVYRKALEMTDKAPSLHAELQKQLAAQQAQQQGMAGGAVKKDSSDFYYDMAGWAVLAGIATMWVVMARNSMK